ncbi:MAG: polysaccharide deacetylase family protein [Bacteroidales bacterium]|nr:polysaccharide deacetylase family protein [Bacteroidales bacterium]
MKKTAIIVVIALIPALISCQPFAGDASYTKEDIHRDKSTGSVSCFAYHRFGDDRFPSTNIRMDVFENQMQYLHENRYSVMALGEALFLLSNGKELPPRAVVLTIDDAYKTFITNAFPVLKKYGFKATLFVSTETIGGGDYMSREDIKKAYEYGIEIGNHSHSHAYFLNHKDSLKHYFKSDLEKANRILKEITGEKPRLYAYPYGEYNLAMQLVVKEAGMKAAAAQKSGVLYAGADRYAIPRFPMGGPFGTFNGFKNKLKMKPLPVLTAKPQSPVFEQNPPELQLEIESGQINSDQIQCFVDGQKTCTIEKETSGQTLTLTIQNQDSMQGRRTLYTITAPSKDGKSWHWYSHLWVDTEVEE